MPRDITRYCVSDPDSVLKKDGLFSKDGVMVPRATLTLRPLNTPMDKKRETMVEIILEKLERQGDIVYFKRLDKK